MGKKGQLVFGFILLAAIVAALLVLYLRAESDSVRTLFLSLLILVVLFGGGLLLWQLAHKPGQLRRLLNDMDQAINMETLEVLKELYLQIYNLYMRLSEKQKRNFYARVMEPRERVEEMMRAAKKLELLLGTAFGSIAERKKQYEEAHAHFQKLPEKAQQQYYHSLLQWKEQLEKGK